MVALDVRLLGFIGFASAVLLAVGMQLMHRVMPNAQAIRSWSRGATCGALAFSFGYLRDALSLPLVVSAAGLHALGLLGVAMLYRGVREALHQPVGFRWVPFAAVWGLVYVVVFTAIWPSVAARTLCFCLSLGVLHALQARVSLASPQARQDANRGTWQVLGVVHLLAAGIFFVQAATSPFLPTVNAIGQMTQPIHLLGFAMIFINNLSQTFGLMYVTITRREQALREGERRYRDLVDQTADGILVIGPDGRLQAINPAGALMLGDNTVDLLQRHLLDLIAEEDRVQVAEQMRRHQGDEVRCAAWRFVRKDGAVFPGEVLSRRLKDGGLQAIVRDITERQAVQSALERAKAEAEAGNRAKSAFLANMSHEIRTPMNAIMGFTNILKMDVTEPQHQTYLNKIMQASRHLLAIINDILDLSKIDAGELRLERISTDVRQIGQHVHALLVDAAAKKGLRLIFDCDPHVPDQLVGDPTRLTQALYNLASNAVKFTHQGEVRLHAGVRTAAAESVLLYLEVRDTGVGISERAQASLFKPFAQGDDSMTRLHGGTGLGLTLTRRLAEMMGGTVGVQSQPGVGSTFWFTARLRRALPERRVLDVRQTPEFTQAYMADLRRALGGARVLLVEDDPLNQEMALILLENLDLQVTLANDGLEAVDHARRRGAQPDCDLVLMDIQMARLDGLQATQRIRELAAWDAVPIVAMTANTFVEDQRRAMEAGMNDFVSKPVQAERLYEVLRKWLKPRAA